VAAQAAAQAAQVAGSNGQQQQQQQPAVVVAAAPTGPQKGYNQSQLARLELGGPGFELIENDNADVDPLKGTSSDINKWKNAVLARGTGKYPIKGTHMANFPQWLVK
jgi:hypothetical protein